MQLSLATGSLPCVRKLPASLHRPGILNCNMQSQPFPSFIELGRFKVFSALFLHTLGGLNSQTDWNFSGCKNNGKESKLSSDITSCCAGGPRRLYEEFSEQPIPSPPLPPPLWLGCSKSYSGSSRPQVMGLGSKWVHNTLQLVSIYFPPHCLPFGRADNQAPCVGVLPDPVAAHSVDALWVQRSF